MKKLTVALMGVLAVVAGSCTSGSFNSSPPTPPRHPSYPAGRATATMTSCSSAGGSTTLTGKVTNPLPDNPEVIAIDGRFSPTTGSAVEIEHQFELGAHRVSTFTIQVPVPNAACSVARTHVDFVLIPGIPYDPQNSGTLTGNGLLLLPPTSLVGRPLRS